jgi:hypothetical protein
MLEYHDAGNGWAIFPLELVMRAALRGWLGGSSDVQASTSLLVLSLREHWRDDFLADVLRETMAAAKPSRYEIADRLSNITAHRSLVSHEGLFSRLPRLTLR